MTAVITKADLRDRIGDKLGFATTVAPLAAEDTFIIEREIDDSFAYLQQREVIVFDPDNTPDFAVQPLVRFIAANLTTEFEVETATVARLGRPEIAYGALVAAVRNTQRENDEQYF